MPVSIFSETELARLASFPEKIPSDDLIRAFTLRWIENQDYRRRIHRQLNKGEALHALRRFLFFAHEGKLQRRQADQQTNQILCLNLVTNALVTWNTVYMNAAIERLRAEGRIDPVLLTVEGTLRRRVARGCDASPRAQGQRENLRPARGPKTGSGFADHRAVECSAAH